MNKVILTGRLTKDPDYSTVGSKATPRAMFSMAVERRYAAQGQQRITDFPNVVCWDKTAEFAAKYLKKGIKIILEGRLQTRSYDAQDGTKRFVTEVIADNIEFCESKREVRSDSEDADQHKFVPVEDDQLPF